MLGQIEPFDNGKSRHGPEDQSWVSSGVILLRTLRLRVEAFSESPQAEDWESLRLTIQGFPAANLSFVTL